MSVLSKVKHVVFLLLHGAPKKTVANIVQLAPNNLLKGRCAIVTGGTSGIGFSIASAFLDAGACVVITGRNKERIDSACTKLSHKGIIIGCILDNTDISSFETGFSSILNRVQEYGIQSVDILVNNAGVLGGVLPNATEDQYDSVMNTNLKASFFLSQLFSKYLISNHIKGNILNVASSSSLRPAISAYTLSKWGIRGLTMGLARALAPYGITVNGIAPGQTATPMLKDNGDDNLSNDTCLLGRWILPEEIANGAVFLVSDMGRAVIGDILYMTGGSGNLSFEDMNYNIFNE